MLWNDCLIVKQNEDKNMVRPNIQQIKKMSPINTSLPFNVNYHQDHSLMAPKFDADP